MSARIGDGLSSYEEGEISFVNEPAKKLGIAPGVKAKEAQEGCWKENEKKEDGMKTSVNWVWFKWIIGSLCLVVFPAATLAAPITLKLGHTGPPKSIYDVVSYKLAERVTANSGGNLEVKVFGNSKFGDIAQHWGQVKSGAPLTSS